MLLIFLLLRGKPEARRSRYLIGVCFFNLALFAGYKLSLSMDAAYMCTVCALSRLTQRAEEVSFS